MRNYIQKPGVLKSSFSCKSLLFFFLEQPPDEVLGVTRTFKSKLLGKIEFSLNDVGYRVAVVFGLEGCETSHEFEDGDHEGPYVDHLIVASTLKHFRGTIVGGASER